MIDISQVDTSIDELIESNSRYGLWNLGKDFYNMNCAFRKYRASYEKDYTETQWIEIEAYFKEKKMQKLPKKP